MGARQRITSAGSFQQISVANNKNRLRVRGLRAAQEWLHFVVLMSTANAMGIKTAGLEK
jgi:hypothetical protein